MADDLGDTSILQDADQAAEAAAKTARSREVIAKRDVISGAVDRSKVGDLDDGGGALDSALAEVRANPELPVSGDVTPAPGVPAAAKSKDDVPAEPTSATEPLDGGDALDKLIAAATTTPETSKPQVEPPLVEPRSDPYAEHQLPANASQKSKDSFANLKSKAGTDLRAAVSRAEAAEARIQQAEREAEEARAQVGKIPTEVETELKELREHRALFDTQHDPEFRKRFDVKIDRSYEAIYTRLLAHQLPQKEIDVLRAMKSADRQASIDNMVAQLGDASQRRPFEIELMSIAQFERDRDAELAETKGKAETIIKQRVEAPKAEAARRVNEVVELVRPRIDKLAFLKVQKVDVNTPPELKKKIEADNEFALSLQQELAEAIRAETPETRTKAAIAVPLSLFFMRELTARNAEVAELKVRLEKITKASSTSRLNERAPSSRVEPAKAKVSLSSDRDEVEDHLDALFKESGGSL